MTWHDHYCQEEKGTLRRTQQLPYAQWAQTNEDIGPTQLLNATLKDVNIDDRQVLKYLP